MSTDKLPSDVINFLERERVNEIQQEGDITVSQAAKQWGCTNGTALKRLKELVSEGKLTQHTGILLNKSNGYFFRMVREE